MKYVKNKFLLTMVSLGILLSQSAIAAPGNGNGVKNGHGNAKDYAYDIPIQRAKNNMESRIQLGRLKAGDIKTSGVFSDSAGTVNQNSVTDTIQVSKVSSLGQRCVSGSLARTAQGDLLSCKGGTYQAGTGGLSSSQISIIKRGVTYAAIAGYCKSRRCKGSNLGKSVNTISQLK